MRPLINKLDIVALFTTPRSCDKRTDRRTGHGECRRRLTNLFRQLNTFYILRFHLIICRSVVKRYNFSRCKGYSCRHVTWQEWLKCAEDALGSLWALNGVRGTWKRDPSKLLVNQLTAVASLSLRCNVKLSPISPKPCQVTCQQLL